MTDFRIRFIHEINRAQTIFLLLFMYENVWKRLHQPFLFIVQVFVATFVYKYIMIPTYFNEKSVQIGFLG